MPLVQREVHPIFLSHGLDTIPDGIEDELQCITNFTLTSIIRQLGNMARLADDVFMELLSETNVVCQKSNALQDRIDKISAMVTQLDPAHDQDTLEDFLSKTPYQSEFYDDQIILNSKSQPLALQQTRSMCEPVPPLNCLDPYREDGKEALKMYTNPKYFFELWCQKMERNIKREEDRKAERKRKRIEEKKHKKHENKGKSKIPARLDQSWKWKNARMAKGIEFMDESTEHPNNSSSSEELNEEHALKSRDEELSPSETDVPSSDPPQSSPTSLQPFSTSHKGSLGSSQPSSDCISSHQLHLEVAPTASLQSSHVSTGSLTTSFHSSAAFATTSLGSSQPSHDLISPHQIDLAPTEVPIESLQPSIVSTGLTTSPDFSSAPSTTSLGASQSTHGHISAQELDAVSPQNHDASSQPDSISPQFCPATTPEYNSDFPLANLAPDHLPLATSQPPHPPPDLPSINIHLVRRRESRSDLLDAIHQGIPLRPVPRAASIQDDESDIVKALFDRRRVLAPDYDTDSDKSSYFSTEEENEVD